MRVDVFSAAVRLITAGPGDQPLMRLLEIAMEASQCSGAFIAARHDDGARIIASKGLTLAEFREVLPSAPEIQDLFSRSVIVQDATQNETLKNAYMVQHGWLFFANVPLPLELLPFPVTITCMDPRVDIERSGDMLARLETCAAIAADQIRMIGEIGWQAATLAATFSDIAGLRSLINTSAIPVMLFDNKLALCAISKRAAQHETVSPSDLQGLSIWQTRLTDDPLLIDRIADVIASGNAVLSHILLTPDGRALVVDAFRQIANDTGEMYAVVAVIDRSSAYSRENGIVASMDSPGVVSEFLLTTLIRQKRLLRRGPVAYHAIARWRASVKDTQIAALKALKRDPKDLFLNTVVDELALAAGALFGSQTFRAITHVPCGNSGPQCLAAQLAQRLAIKLNVEFIDAFEPIPPSGGSHPRGNLRRQAMKLRTAPTVPILLIDDVATSGAHIEEAAVLLRAAAPAVLPLVWIAD